MRRNDTCAKCSSKKLVEQLLVSHEEWQIIPVESRCEDYQELEKLYAMLSVHMGIPYPERLEHGLLVRKLRQLEWLMKANHLPVKLENDGNILPVIKIKLDTDAEED